MAKKYSNDDDDALQHNRRITDLSAEPRRMLMPIQGYEKKPLVTLEEAVEPIVEYVPDVKRMAHVARMRCNDPPADNLTLDESASIMLYSMDWEPQEECLYHVLNATLRLENRRKLVPWFLFLKLILTAFDRLPSKHRFVYRGVKHDMRKDYAEGTTIIWWGFSSCTSTVGVLSNEQFLGSKGTRTFFTIECTSGKDIRQHSYFQSEDEILLPPGRQFQVVSCLNQSGGLYMIQLQETEPKYPHLQPLSKDVKPIAPAIPATPPSIPKPIKSLTTDNKTQVKESPETISTHKHSNQQLLQRINQKKNASTVRLDGMNLIDADMKIVADHLLENNQTLTGLDLSNNQIGAEGVRYLSNSLQNNKTLTGLDLHNNQIGAEGVRYLSNSLQNNKTLTHLYLHNNQIGDEGVRYLSNSLQNNKTLTGLDLDNNQIGDEGVRYLSNSLQNNKTLTGLWLDNNQIGDEGVRYLSNSLQNNKTLTHLGLDNNQIGAEGVRYLSNSLQNNKTLTLLYLHNNQIGAEGVRYLSNSLQNNKTLTYLSLYNNQIGDEGRHILEKLKKNNPSLTIHF